MLSSGVTLPGHAPELAASLLLAAAAAVLAYVLSSWPPKGRTRLATAALVAAAVGLAAKSALALEAAGILPSTVAVWDTGGVVGARSAPGVTLAALVGYTPRPAALPVALVSGYVGVLVALRARPAGTGFAPLGRDYADHLHRILRARRILRPVPYLAALALAALLAVALGRVSVGPFDNASTLRLGRFSSAENDASLFSFALWVVWLPLLLVATLLFARVWCGIACPLRLATDGARRLGAAVGLERGLALPATLRSGWLAPALFAVVTFAVTTLPVQRQARAGAWFFLCVFAAATLAGLVLRQGTWCRYLCPIGGLLGRIARLSPLALRPDRRICVDCREKPCLTGAVAGHCPVALNPSRLETNAGCLLCFTCVRNCPAERASMRIGVRAPAAELLSPRRPRLVESLVAASLIGLYAAVGHRSATLASMPRAVVFAALVGGATALYLLACAAAARVARIGFRRAVATFGYAFLPLELAVAAVVLCDDALDFLGVTQTGAVVLVSAGFAGSAAVLAAIVGNRRLGARRGLAAAIPFAALLVLAVWVWLGWYAGPTTVDLT